MYFGLIAMTSRHLHIALNALDRSDLCIRPTELQQLTNRTKSLALRLYICQRSDITELDDLIGKHIFVNYTYNRSSTIVKGLVLGVQRGRLKLKLTGNGPAFDHKTITTLGAEVQHAAGRVLTAEADGDLPNLGRWQD